MGMDLEGTALSEISRTEKSKTLYVLTYMWNLKQSSSQRQRTDGWLPQAGGGQWVKWAKVITSYNLQAQDK